MSVIGLTFHLYMSILLVILDFYFPPYKNATKEKYSRQCQLALSNETYQ